MTPRRRLTVALVLEGAVRDEVDGLRRALGSTAVERIGPHVTLVPPVNVREDELGAALDHVRAVCAPAGPVHLVLGPVATFAPATPVVYLAVGGDLAELSLLQERLGSGPLAPPPGRGRHRPYVPHVTLDQRSDRARIPSVVEVLSAYRAETTLARVTVLEFHEAERRWAPMADFSLGGGRLVGRGGFEVELSAGSMLDPIAHAFMESEWSDYAREAYGDGSADEPFALAARVGGELVGTATGQLRADCCRLAKLIVGRRWRSLGVGSHLLRAVEALGREHGAPFVRLETRLGGAAERFYAERGYEVTTSLPRWRRGHDFVVMERRL